MPNQYVNKVAVNGETIIDLTADTVTASDVAVGKSFHLASGAQGVGTAVKNGSVYQDENGYVVLDDEPGANVSVIPLSVTENGTYTAPTGTAYSPVTVDVAGSDISFSPRLDGKNHYYVLLTTDLEYELVLSAADDVDWGDGTQEFNVSVGTHVYQKPGIYEITFSKAHRTWTNMQYRHKGKLIYAEIVNTIGTNQFDACYGLAGLYIAYEIPSYYTTYLCRNAYPLQYCKLPDSITSIGNSAFYECNSMRSITLPSSLISIEGNAFNRCRALESITIPQGVTSIGGGAFQFCVNLTEYHFLPTTPPTLGSSTALQTPTGCKIYVPQGSLEAYQTAENWSTYASYIQEEVS